MNAFTSHCLDMKNSSKYETITFATVDEIMFEFEDTFAGDVEAFWNETALELVEEL